MYAAILNSFLKMYAWMSAYKRFAVYDLWLLMQMRGPMTLRLLVKTAGLHYIRFWKHNVTKIVHKCSRETTFIIVDHNTIVYVYYHCHFKIDIATFKSILSVIILKKMQKIIFHGDITLRRDDEILPYFVILQDDIYLLPNNVSISIKINKMCHVEKIKRK